MNMIGKWEAFGQVVECKALTSKKSDWKGWMIRVQVLGATLEVMCSEDAYGQFQNGDVVACQGRLEPRSGGGYNLELERWEKKRPAA